MSSQLSRALAAVLLVLCASRCQVQETHARCEKVDDCPIGQECYLGYCVLEELPDAALGSRTDDSRADASSALRRRKPPSLSEFSDDTDSGVGLSAARHHCTDADDAGSSDGTCCEADVPCYDGPAGTAGIGRCKAGLRACNAGRFGACEGSLLPRAEACDNLGSDDDCDGKLDNIRGLGDACMLADSQKQCGQGVRSCVEGAKGLQCRPQSPPAEQCNQKDDDCDGQVDEGFDLKQDEKNCGACGKTCANAQACCAASCVTKASTQDGCPECGAEKSCAAGASCCSGACRDTQTDHDNCGKCGNACGARETCCGGQCIDTRADRMNCGACGNVCAQGVSPACCDGGCVDLSSDRRNCGQCRVNCGAVCTCEVSNGQAQCRGGVLGFCF